MNWWLAAVKKYAVFSGRARRKEYWYYVLFNFIIAFVWGMFAGVVGAMAGWSQTTLEEFANVPTLALLLPSLAVAVRRLHDTGRSGWWLLLAFVPIIGAIILIVWYCQDSEPGTNQYGPNPKTEIEGTSPIPT